MSDPSHLKRRLSAIAFADVAGFSRFVAVNEVGTLTRWKMLQTQILEPYALQHGGRIVQTVGDAVLVEFPSAVVALQWAIDVQRTVQIRQGELDPPILSLRIGINVDDIIDDDGELHGDGVNIAARIHQAAQPGQIVVTSSVRDYVINRLPVAFSDLGSPPLKNIDRPVRLFALNSSQISVGELAPNPYLHWSSRPTVAVLPFRNSGRQKSDSYFREGITEDIINGLSRSRAFYVIARTSTLRYGKRTTNLRQIADELDVKYILDGKVRRIGADLRITAELIDVAVNRTLWADRYDGTGDDLFTIQDHIVARIVGSLEPRLQAAEIARARERSTQSLGAYECVLKALSRLYELTEESYHDTGELLDRALILDPTYARAHAYMAWHLNFLVGEGRSANPEADRARAMEAAQRAIELDPEDAFALAVAGHVISFLGRKPDEAIDLFDSALKLNENSAFAWALSALNCAYRGYPDEALDRLRNVWQLSPFDPLDFFFWIIAGIAEFIAGRYGEAVAWLRRALRANRRSISCRRILAASLALAGDEQGAKLIGNELLAIDPSFRVSSFVNWYPLQRPDDLKRLQAGLSFAGLPD